MTMDAPVISAVRDAIQRQVLAGAVTLVWRRGEVVELCAEGYADREASRPMRPDTLFRIASMTKPITSALAMMMIEDGALAPDDPITRWLPEFAAMRVLRDPQGPLAETEASPRAMTVEDLLSHRAGLSYAFLGQTPLAEAYEARLGPLIDNPLAPDDWIAALATLPLASAPGERFTYGYATDLLGFLLSRIAGEDLASLMQRRVFGPLGMADTGFALDPAKAHRAAVPYRADGAGGLDRVEPPPRAASARFVSGGQGLWSTAADYLRFARLLMGGGEVDGVRLLRADSVASMLADRLTPQDHEAGFLGLPMFGGHGFGRGLAVVTDPTRAFPVLGQGGAGSFGWPGAFGTWWQADPQAQMILIYLVQVSVSSAQMAAGHGLGAFAAQVGFERSAYAAFAGPEPLSP